MLYNIRSYFLLLLMCGSVSMMKAAAPQQDYAHMIEDLAGQAQNWITVIDGMFEQKRAVLDQEILNSAQWQQLEKTWLEQKKNLNEVSDLAASSFNIPEETSAEERTEQLQMILVQMQSLMPEDVLLKSIVSQIEQFVQPAKVPAKTVEFAPEPVQEPEPEPVPLRTQLVDKEKIAAEVKRLEVQLKEFEQGLEERIRALGFMEASIPLHLSQKAQTIFNKLFTAKEAANKHIINLKKALAAKNDQLIGQLADQLKEYTANISAWDQQMETIYDEVSQAFKNKSRFGF